MSSPIVMTKEVESISEVVEASDDDEVDRRNARTESAVKPDAAVQRETNRPDAEEPARQSIKPIDANLDTEANLDFDETEDIDEFQTKDEQPQVNENATEITNLESVSDSELNSAAGAAARDAMTSSADADSTPGVDTTPASSSDSIVSDDITSASSSEPIAALDAASTAAFVNAAENESETAAISNSDPAQTAPTYGDEDRQRPTHLLVAEQAQEVSPRRALKEMTIAAAAYGSKAAATQAPPSGRSALGKVWRMPKSAEPSAEFGRCS